MGSFYASLKANNAQAGSDLRAEITMSIVEKLKTLKNSKTMGRSYKGQFSMNCTHTLAMLYKNWVMIWLHIYRVMDAFGMLNDKIITLNNCYHSVVLSKVRSFINILKKSVTVNQLFKCCLYTCLQ